MLKFMSFNSINMAWMQMGRYFSPWTGKTFEDMRVAKLKEITDGYERGDVPTLWGANTQTLRTPNEKFVGKLMKLLV